MAKKKKYEEFKPNDILIKNRQLFLYEAVTEKSAARIITSIMALDLENKKQITLWINSEGGSTTNGLAIINTMQAAKSKIITIINAQACSMASLISCAGDVRKIVANGEWMAHDMKGGIFGDYSDKVRDRAEWIEKHFQLLTDVYKKHTKLTKKDLERARHGELWLDAEQCLKKGIVDKII